MKIRITLIFAVMATGGFVNAAFGKLPIAPVAPAASELDLPVPQLNNFPEASIGGKLVNKTLRERTMPGLYDRLGNDAIMKRVIEDPVKRSHAIGHLAEEDFFARNPDWHQTLSPNAPQNDGWTWFQGKRYGVQIKTHRSGDPSEYLRDMFQKDTKAERFLIPEDHVAAVKNKIEQQLEKARLTGNERVAAEWQRQMNRLGSTGRTYAEYDEAILTKATAAIRFGKAVNVGTSVVIFSTAIDGAVVIYHSAERELTPEQTVEGIVEAGVKGVGTGTAITTAVILGANPVGFTVIVVGGVTYIVVDYVAQELESRSQSSPMTEAEINAAMPRDWYLEKP